MKTTNVDLAAYLHLAGVQPECVALDTQSWIVYDYRDTDYLRDCVAAFQGDGIVPMRAFVEARKHVKGMAGLVASFPKSNRQKLRDRRAR